MSLRIVASLMISGSLLLSGCARNVTIEQPLSAALVPSGTVPTPPPLPTVTPMPNAAVGQANGLVAAAAPLSAPAPPPVAATPPDLDDQIDAYLRDLAAQGLFSGAVVVASAGQPIVMEGYGFANYESQTPNTSATRFRIASVSKQFTAAAILILAAEGRLRLEDSACAHLASCPPAWQPMTIHQLLNHTSGLPNYTDFFEFSSYETSFSRPDQLLARFRDMPLNFAPGSAFAYTNSNYLVLSQIIEQVSGQSFAEFLQTRIFAPLGMENSGVDPGDFGPLGATRGYLTPGVPALAINTSNLYGSGDLYSTVIDLLRWDQALYSDALLPAEWRIKMFTPGLQDFGYGFKMTYDRGYRRTVHAGNMSGVSSYLVRYPDQQKTIIVLSNLEYANTIGIANRIGEMLLPTPRTP